MRLSLVLATYGRATELRRCFESLAAQTDRGFELLVMDQNPDDRLADLVGEYRGRGLLIRHERLPKPGLAEARNRGIRIAEGEIVAFPDDDCWYEPDTVASIKATFQSDPAISGVVANWVEESCGSGGPSEVMGELLSLSAWRKFRGGAASSISLFLKRDLLLDLGGFDDRLGVGKWFGAAEETDLVLRALTSGAKLIRSMNACVHHAYEARQLGDWRQATGAVRRRARGTGALYAKHRLETAVILRGFLAPFVLALIRRQGLPGLALGLATALGRLEGWWRWPKENSQ